MSSQLTTQLEEVRRRAVSRLSSSGSALDVKADVQVMASIPLPLAEKYRLITAETMVKENTGGDGKQGVMESLSRLFKALSILEKYGCNLTNPNRPRYWRSVKHNNPVFRSTVEAIKGGRGVLYLYGYTNQQFDGLSFPDDVDDPDVDIVAAVTLEVMTLRSEVDMLIKGTHPHPELFKDVIQQADLGSDAVVIPPGEERVEGLTQSLAPPTPASPAHGPGHGQPSTTSTVSPSAVTCNCCGGAPSLLCPSCGHIPLCEQCDLLLHRNPSRADHKRDTIHKQDSCSLCGITSVFAHCSTCVQRLCLNCDKLYHTHPDRKGHNRATVTPAKPSGSSLSAWECSHCTTVNEVRAALCVTCERPRLATASSGAQGDPGPSSPNAAWHCKSCTVVNQGSSVLCEACERPRLATRPPVTPALSVSGSLADAEAEWMCQICTFMNSRPVVVCEMCNLPRKDSASVSSLQQPSIQQPLLQQPLLQQPLLQHPLLQQPLLQQPLLQQPLLQQPLLQQPLLQQPLLQQPLLQHPLLQQPLLQQPLLQQEPPQPAPRVSLEQKRQKLMRDNGLKLIHQIREAEKTGVSPEEVYAALCVCSGSNVDPCDWLKSELPHVLDEICAMAASVQESYSAKDSGSQDNVEGDGGTSERCGSYSLGEGVQLSRAEAKQAWLAAGGDTERAVRQLLRDRKTKMKELRSLGFREVSRCEEALRQSGGEVKGALSLLQRPLLEPFHQRIWSDQPEAPFDAKHPDKQRMCRRLLALYDLPSWGRCELALSLLQEPGITYSLEDVVQAVKESQDRDFIRRLLINECPCCLDIIPRSKMQSLTSCQCSVCHECFTQHFTIAVRDKHIRDMVCPVCGGPDINDPEQLDSHFSTLDIQLRDCLKLDVYDLFHKKLRDHALMKDPKFLWCCHCTYGFIYDGDQLKVTCPTCIMSFCAQCKKPWESQHQDLSCEQFQLWKRENDPEYQRQGLAGYLSDNGIICPHCRFQYALTKGGCMHFTCSQCRYQFCSGCNNPFHTTACKTAQCKMTGLHAHHPRDCLFYLRDWEPPRLQALLQGNAVEFNVNSLNEAQTDACGVMEQKDEDGQPTDSPCGIQTQPGHAGLCEKHYKEYLVSLINGHTLEPALLYDSQELTVACDRYQVDIQRGENEEDDAYHARLRTNLMEVPLGENVPRTK